jgi:transposase-like protein
VLLCADAAAASADLAGGMLACPSCRAGRLKRWGYGRERAVRLLGGATARLRPQRARCGSCRRTHVLLPSWCAPRRADAIEVIGTAAGMALAGAGYGRIGAGLGVPAATVRGWLRRLRCRAEAMRQDAMHQLGFVGGLADPPAARPGRLAAR